MLSSVKPAESAYDRRNLGCAEGNTTRLDASDVYVCAGSQQRTRHSGCGNLPAPKGLPNTARLVLAWRDGVMFEILLRTVTFGSGIASARSA